MNYKKTLLILAGGLGSRYKGLKQVDGIMDNGSPILEYSIFDALEAGFTKIVVIINRFIPESYITRLKEISEKKNFDLVFVYQDIKDFLLKDFDISERQKPWGTAHAILCAKNTIQEPFVIINADDFYGKEIYKLASEQINEGQISENQYELIAYPLNTTLSENGTVARGICSFDEVDNLLHIKEQTSIRTEGQKIVYSENDKTIEVDPETLVSMNYFVFHPSIFENLELYFEEFLQSKPASTQEFYIPSAVQRMINEKKVNVLLKKSPSQWMGMTYADDKNIMKNYLETQIQEKNYPEDLWK
ncbi:sugar phosphate nucleotidyltransferase [Chryseobacterium sp.]|uniref:sugar phosphate nucleotidyltransferase n=1 Tax=Chryseobacterium sp. TaxID=1871047 RepID=UPI00388DAE3B